MLETVAGRWRALGAAQRDLAVIGGLDLALWGLIERSRICDRLFAWIARHPDYEADSLLLAFLLAAIGIAVFAWRRYRELQVAVRAREQIQHEYHTLAHHDPLTGLPNRRALSERLRAACAEGEALRLLLIDLDRFKVVNDLHGHSQGDQLLRQVGRRLAGALSGAQRVYRLGGDEFAVVQPVTQDPALADEGLGERLVRLLEQPVRDGGLVHHIGASVGIARYPADSDDPDTLLRAADVALYAAKDAGRGRCRRFAPQMAEELARRAAIERDIRAGIAAGEFVPFFQPIVSLHDGRITGYEVLSRWQRSDREQIGPEVFIPIADECGLINDLSLAVLERACVTARSWDPVLELTFNFSPNQLRDPLLCQRVLAALARAGFPAGRLGIEITEDAIIADEQSARRVIESFKNQGVRIALDDFGTGYSSLHHLRSLPFDRIKIDRTFVRDMALDRDDANALQIVKAIVGLAHSLDMRVTAEGVEDPHVAEDLRRLGCDSGQGFHFGMPAAGVREDAPPLRRRRS